MADYSTSSKLISRADGLASLEKQLAVSLQEIINSYGDTTFRNSDIKKSILLNEIISLNLSDSVDRYIGDKCNLPFHKDARSSVEYGLDLVFGWLSEDIVLAALKKNGTVINLAGEDRHREFLSTREIGTTADYLIEFKGVKRHMEIVISWNDYWEKTGSWDLRESKFKQMTVPGSESLCLGIEPSTQTGFLIDMAQVKDEFKKRPNPAWGGKMVYTLNQITNSLKPAMNIIETLT